ncbi:MAG: hypothetical protein HP498_10685 [Nitrospira sp.]|nr:hypothetical protein [Nitrospira sp.]
MKHLNSPPAYLGLSLLIMMGPLISVTPLWAVPMANDPKGFHGIAWGTSLTARQDLETIHSGTHVTEYRPKTNRSTFAGAEMTSILYVSVDDQFARVTIRYEGEQVHKQVLNFLEAQFGSLQRVPGQMARGLNQQYTWRGPDTEINVTYQAGTERGYLFIDSRTLAPRFNDYMTDSAE